MTYIGLNRANIERKSFGVNTGVQDLSILELGAGKGYFLPLVLRRFSGQIPSKIIITDQSMRLLEIAQRFFRINNASYQTLDVSKSFRDDEFNLIIATMIINEVNSYSFNSALKECYRVLSPSGKFLITITHPDFIDGLEKKGLLKSAKDGFLTMPASGDLRLPVVVRSLEATGKAWRKQDLNLQKQKCSQC